MSQAGSGLSRFITGGTGAQNAANRAGLAGVVELGPGAVGHDGADLAGLQSRLGERRTNRQFRTGSIRVGCGDMEGVAGEPGTSQRRVDARSAGLGVLERLKHEHRCAFGRDEAGAIRIEWSRQRAGVAFGGRQCTRVGEAAHQVRRQGCIAGTGEHDFGVAPLQRVEALGDRNRAGCAGPHSRCDRPRHSKLDRGVGCSHVARDERHVQRPRALGLLEVLDDLIVALGDSPGAGVDRDAGAWPRDVVEPCVGNSESRSNNRELGKASHATGRTLVHVRRQIEVFDRGGVTGR